MASPQFIITDGTFSVDLLSRSPGYHINDWTPAVADIKDGGVFQSSPFVDGRKLAYRKFANATETLDIKLDGGSQDLAILALQDLRRLLEKAVAYWTSDWQGSPVWIEARGSLETNKRYAVIVDYRALADDNPYAQPFFDCNPVVDNFALILERGHWLHLPPGQGDCIQISSRQDWNIGEANLVLNPGYETAGGGGADVFQSWTEHTTGGTSAITNDTVDFFEGAHSCRLYSDETFHTSDISQTIAVTGFSPYHFSFYGYGDEYGSGKGGFYEILDMTHGGVTIVYLPGPTGDTWENIAFNFTTPAGCLSIKITFYSPDDPEIIGFSSCHVDYVSLTKIVVPVPPGRLATCNANEVFITNKWIISNITHIFAYDSSGASFSTNLMLSAVPIALFPASPDVNDIVYFGVDSSFVNDGPFTSLIFDLGALAVNITAITWQYWNGISHTWATLSVQDNTALFTNPGVVSVHWEIPSQWFMSTVNGVNGNWVRAIITAVGGATTSPYQQNRTVYTSGLPYIDIDKAQVLGDIPALARMKLKNVSDKAGGSTPVTSIYEAYVSLRSRDRGSSFYEFINISDTQNISGLTCVAGAHTLIQAWKPAPSGRSAIYNPVGVDAFNIRAYIGIDSTILFNFMGEFHIFMRSFQVGGTNADMTCRLVINIGNTVIYTSDDKDAYITTDSNKPQSIDFGVIDIGKLSKRHAVGINTSFMTFSIYVDNNPAAGNGDLYLYDLVLVPTDEFCVHLITKSDPFVNDPTHGVELLSIDSVSVPAEEMINYASYDSSGLSISEWEHINVGPFILQSNSNQRIFTYFISANSNVNFMESNPDITLSVKSLEKVNRYLSMRGIR